MILRRPDQRERPAYDHMIPLINIVFLMLIFFMVVGQIVTPDLFTVHPPESHSEEDATSEGVVILVDPEGRIAVDNVPVKLEKLAPALIRHRTDYETSGAVGTFETPILKADARLTAEQWEPILAEIRSAGILTVTIQTADAF